MELFRFRIVRPVLSQPSDGLNVVSMFQPPLAAEELRVAADEAANRPPAPAVTAIERWLSAFSSQLALQADLVSPQDCIKLLPHDWLGQVASQDWSKLGQQLALSLVKSMEQEPEAPAAVESQCRLLLVLDLVLRLATDQPKPAGEHTLKTATDVQAMVSWRHVVLPADFFPGPSDTPLLARRPGITNFYVVRDEWNHYEASELAAVINVLPGETFENRIRHSQEVDTVTSTTTVTTTSQMTQQQQTTSSSLSEASTNAVSTSVGVQGQVQASYDFGPTHIATSLGAQLQTSQSQSDSKASTTAYQTLQLAVKSVSQQVTSVQSQRTMTRDSTYDDHKLQNTSRAVTVGMYRWLTEIHYAQLVKYPHRFVLEFEIPEPGAWLRWALQNHPTDSWDNPDPGPFRLPNSDQDLSPRDITSENWMQLAQQWRVRGLGPPPPGVVNLSTTLTGSEPKTPIDLNNDVYTYVLTDDSLTVPTGYTATAYTAQIASWVNPLVPGPAEIYISVGGGDQQHIEQPINQNAGHPIFVGGIVPVPGDAGPVPGDAGNITSTIPVAVFGYIDLMGITVVVNVECHLLDETLWQWQETTFDQIAAAYQSLVNAFHQERDARNQQVSGATNLTGPPALNQQRAVSELRRMVIQDLTGQLISGTGDVQDDRNPPFPWTEGEPYVLLGPLADTDMIQFFEQALEWENIVYVCYPYYWARHNQWITDATSASSDPVFDQFLNAGSARVVVPARPGFENLMLYYLYTDQIWGGSQPPAPNDPDYLSVAQEIEAMQRGATDGKPVPPSWEVKLPTTLLWAGTDPRTLPVNPAPTIPKPPRQMP